MTTTVLNRIGHPMRRARLRHYLMCPPTYFDVVYSINPWMDPSVQVDRALAIRQWSGLVDAYRSTGHRVDLLDPLPGMPDMVFAANGATVVDGHTLLAKFANQEREAEVASHAEWHRRNGILYGAGHMPEPNAVNEAEGDFAILSRKNPRRLWLSHVSASSSGACRADRPRGDQSRAGRSTSVPS